MVAINSYQTKKQNANVHGKVKHNLSDLAHKSSQYPWYQFCITKDFKWKSQDHKEVRNDSVLEEDDEIGFTGYFKKDPHCQAIHCDTHQEQNCIKQRKNDLTDSVIAGAVAVVSRVAEVGYDFHLHFVFPPFPVKTKKKINFWVIAVISLQPFLV